MHLSQSFQLYPFHPSPADKLYATAADRVLLCHPFLAMRDDKKPAEVVRET